MKKEKWVAAINRFKTVVEEYDKTIYVEEALHRLVEIYYKIGLVGESKKYAALLGYNYLSSDWYKQSYRVFNKSYVDRTLKINKKGNFITKKFKALIN
jgi:outer membrane protein assembly factor BamD